MLTVITVNEKWWTKSQNDWMVSSSVCHILAIKKLFAASSAHLN